MSFNGLGGVTNEIFVPSPQTYWMTMIFLVEGVDIPTDFVSIAKCICLNCKMYLSKLQILFVVVKFHDCCSGWRRPSNWGTSNHLWSRPTRPKQQQTHSTTSLDPLHLPRLVMLTKVAPPTPKLGMKSLIPPLPRFSFPKRGQYFKPTPAKVAPAVSSALKSGSRAQQSKVAPAGLVGEVSSLIQRGERSPATYS